MSKTILRTTMVLGLVLSGVMMSTAQAQYAPYGNGCNSCGRPSLFAFRPFRNMFNPCCQNTCCQNLQQVSYQSAAVPVYKSVPVTEMRSVKQVVRKPVEEVKYVDQQITEYKQVMEQKTAQIPSVSYQNVTQYKTQTRDYGKWVSYKESIPKVSPCQYDSSPGLLGWWNRTGYRVRSTFTPNSITRRYYQPNVVAQQIPITTQVPVRTMKTMTYNVAKVVPVTRTEKVAVKTIRYEDQVITAQVPVTVMKNVPIGTQTAFGFIPYDGNGTQTATGPTPDPISTKKTAKGDKDDKTSMNTTPRKKPVTYDTELTDATAWKSQSVVQNKPLPQPKSSAKSFPLSPSSPPSIVQVSGWRPRKMSAETPSTNQSQESGKTVKLAHAQH